MSQPPDRSTDAEFRLRSSTSDLTLRIFNLRDYFYTVELECATFRIARDVCREDNIFINYKNLPQFFHDLATQRKPWAGTKEWYSFEHEFKISAACDIMGHITLAILIRKRDGSPEEWELQADLQSELGQMPAAAASVEKFFEINSHAA
ncbi:MAG: DUF6228 family protein [Alphaproteobacteria bacterium]